MIITTSIEIQRVGEFMNLHVEAEMWAGRDYSVARHTSGGAAPYDDGNLQILSIRTDDGVPVPVQHLFPNERVRLEAALWRALDAEMDSAWEDMA